MRGFICVLLMLVTERVSSSLADKVLPLGIENFPPFEYTVDDTVRGVDADIVRDVLKMAGYKVEFKVMPWSRVQALADTGKLAGLFSLTITEQRREKYYFSEPINQVKDVFFKLAEANIDWNELTDLNGYAIVVGQGYQYAPEFMSAMKNRSLWPVSSVSGDSVVYRQLSYLVAKRADLALCEISVCQYLIRQHSPKFDGIDYIDKPVGDIRPYFIAFSKKWPNAGELVAEFNHHLRLYLNSGRHKPVFERYGVTPFNSP